MLDFTVEQAVRKAARMHGIPEAGLLAVIEAESAGQAFWQVNGQAAPPIRFEGHYFYDRLSGEARDRAVAEGLASPRAGAIPNPRSYAARYALLDRARQINEDAANESTSWGMGQVMGANWRDLGYNNVAELVKRAHTVEGQIHAMVQYILKKGVRKDIIDKNWKAVARKYNGPNYAKNQYHIKMEQLYAKWSGETVDLTVENRQLQRMLNVVGNYKLKVDGIVGATTKSAIRDFQIKNGLVADGIYGPITKEILEAVYRNRVKGNEAMTGAVTTASGTVGTAITETAKSIEPLAGISVWVQIVFVGLILVGAFFTVKALLANKGE